MLPLLVKQGFKGNIYSTPATRDVTEWILKDSAHIQMQDAEYLQRHQSPGVALAQPLYTLDDIPPVMEQFIEVPYVRNSGEWFALRQSFVSAQDDIAQGDKALNGIRLKLYDAGHILGSAVVVLEAPAMVRQGFVSAQPDIAHHNNGSELECLVFTGDLGRNGAPLLPDPEYAHEEADVLLMESTYGGRKHMDFSGAKERLKGFVQEIVKSRGKLIMPAFALGRTQEIVYLLHELTDEGAIPRIPTFVDSPLADNITGVFQKHTADFDVESWKQFGAKDEDPLQFSNLLYTRSVEESKRLNSMPGPVIIISASGMCENGRIQHHLRNGIGDPRNIILITGYQAMHTLGRKLVEGEKKIRIYDDWFEVKARIEKLNELSAHADGPELLKYAEHVKGLKHVFLVHGEYQQAAGLKTLINKKHPAWSVSIPERGETVEV
jgi:metallo-beta-lactamase family protein